MSPFSQNSNAAHSSFTNCHRDFQTEVRYLEEERSTPVQWFNILKLTSTDFSAYEQPDEARRRVLLVHHGLLKGFSFAVLNKHVDRLLGAQQAPIPSDEEHLADDGYIQDLRRTRFLYRIAAEDRAAIGAEVVKRTISGALESELEVRCATASGLLSFLLDEPVILDPLYIRGFIQKTVSALDAFHYSEGGERSCRVDARDRRALPSIALEDLGPPSASKIEILLARAEEMSLKLEGTLNPSGKLFPSLLPSPAERSEAAQAACTPEALKKLIIEPYLTFKALLARSGNGFPGHDSRHILYAVPIAALEHSMEMKDKYLQVFGLIGSLFHDAGRIAEATVPFFTRQRAELESRHAQLSACALAGILKDIPRISPAVQTELLLAVAHHDSGNMRNSLLAQFIQTADRLQLVGPEYFVRLLGYQAGCLGAGLYPRTAPRHPRSVLEEMSFYLHNLYPNISRTTSEREQDLMVCSAAFLLLLSHHDPHIYEVVFPAKNVTYNGSWHELPNRIEQRAVIEFRAAIRASQIIPGELGEELAHYQATFSPHDICWQLLSLPGLASLDFPLPPPAKTARDTVTEVLSQAAKVRGFHLGMSYLMAKSRRHSEAMRGILAEALEFPNPAIRCLAEQISLCFGGSPPRGALVRPDNRDPN